MTKHGFYVWVGKNPPVFFEWLTCASAFVREANLKAIRHNQDIDVVMTTVSVNGESTKRWISGERANA